MVIDEKMPTDTIEGYKASPMAKSKGIYLHGDSNTEQEIMTHSVPRALQMLIKQQPS